MLVLICLFVYYQSSVVKLRAQCAGYVRAHEDDFLPFLTDPKTGDLFTNGERRGGENS